MPRTILGRDDEGRVTNIEITTDEGPIGDGGGGDGGGDGGPHEHPELVHQHPFASDAHTHAAGSHPDLAAHTALGLAPSHAHDFADLLHTHDTGHNHDGTYAPVHAHDFAPSGHAHDLSHSHTAGEVGASASGHNHDGSYATPHSSHAHIHTAADVGASASDHTHGGGGGEAFPVGYVYISVDSTDPATVLGYGTWEAFGAGRVLVGLDAGDPSFDTVQETGGAKTHTLTEAEMPSHTHVEQNNSATTGGLAGWPTRDTSTNTPVATGYSTQATGGGGAHNNLQPYIVVRMWKRTA